MKEGADEVSLVVEGAAFLVVALLLALMLRARFGRIGGGPAGGGGGGGGGATAQPPKQW